MFPHDAYKRMSNEMLTRTISDLHYSIDVFEAQYESFLEAAKTELLGRLDGMDRKAKHGWLHACGAVSTHPANEI